MTSRRFPLVPSQPEPEPEPEPEAEGLEIDLSPKVTPQARAAVVPPEPVTRVIVVGIELAPSQLVALLISLALALLLIAVGLFALVALIVALGALLSGWGR